MTVPHTSGTITLVKGSADVTGIDTAWAAALIVGGTLYVNVPNVGAMALPILTVDSNVKITAAIPWNGANGTYTYALVRDGAFERQSVENAVKLSALLNEMRSAAVTALAGLTPAADKLPYFGAQGAGALADFNAAARALLAGGAVPDGQLPTRLRSLPTIVADANSALTNGFYAVSGATINIPEGAQGSLFVTMVNAGAGTQVYVRSSSGVVWRRTIQGGAFGAWSKDVVSDALGVIADGGLPARLRAISTRAPATANWLDNIQEFGCVAVDAANVATVNGPPGAPGGLVITTVLSTTYISQLYISVSAGGNCRQWQRMRGPSGWLAWQLTAIPILGTVSQSAGVPTGAIIERGSNANGEYVRFADGTQITWNNSLLIKPASDATVGVKSVTWTYPASFVGVPVILHTITTSVPQNRGQNSATGGAANAVLYSYEAVASATDLSTRAFATGRWY